MAMVPGANPEFFGFRVHHRERKGLSVTVDKVSITRAVHRTLKKIFKYRSAKSKYIQIPDRRCIGAIEANRQRKAPGYPVSTSPTTFPGW